MGMLCQTPTPTSVPTISASETQLPAWYQTALEGLDTSAGQIAGQAYTPYTGSQVAGFTDPTLQSFQNTQNAVGSYQPGLNAGTNMTAQNAAPISGAQINQYMNPYMQDVVNAQQSNANLNFAQQQKQTAQQQVNAGAFGGSRAGVQNSMDQYFQNQLLNQIQAQGSAQAYGNALTTAQQQQQVGLQGGAQMAALGAQQQGLGLQGAAALGAVGTQQQQQNQAGLNVAYQNFQNQLMWPQNQASWLSNILHGQNVGQQTVTQGQQFQPQMSPLTGLAGLGMAAAGASQAGIL